MSSTSPRQGLSKTMRSFKTRFAVVLTLVLLTAVFSASALTANLNGPSGQQAGSIAATLFSMFSGTQVEPQVSATPPVFDERGNKKIYPSSDEPPVLEGTVSFGGTTVGGPTWNRPVQNANLPPVPPLSGTGTATPFATTSFSVTVSGSYVFQTVGTNPANWDDYSFLYQGSFDPNNQFNNILIGNDDNPTIGLTGFTLNLTAGANYILVITGFGNADAGVYSTSISGPGNAVSTTACAAPPSGMVAWYPGEVNTNDIIGDPPNNGTFQGTSAFTTGMVGNGFNLNGASAVQVPPSTTLNVGAGGGISVDAWINPSNTNQSPIVEWNNGTGAGPASGVGVHFWHSVVAPGDLYVNIIDTAGASHIFATAGGVVTTGAFQHVAVTYVQATKAVVLYRNGVSVGSTTLAGVYTPQTGAGYSVYLGRRPAGLAPLNFFTGVLDEVEIFNKSLSSGEVLSIFNAGGFGKCHTSQIQFDIAAQSVPETVGAATLALKRIGANDTAADVNFFTANNTATGGPPPCGAVGIDYSTVSIPTITFAPGERTQTVNVPICDDAVDETDETFTGNISLVTGIGASIGAIPTQTVTILDNDPVPNITVNSASGIEGNPTGPPNTVVFTVTKTGQTVFSSSVAYAFGGGTATGGSSCTVGVDYINTGGSLTFPASLTTDTQQVTVPLCPDTAVEGDETFTITLTPTGATAGGPGTGTIRDDDSTIQFSAAAYAVVEGNAGRPATTNANFTATRVGTGTALPAASVDASTIGAATATGGFLDCTGANSDFVIVSGTTINWAAGDVANKTFTVLVCQDNTVENDETFTGQLSNPVNTQLAAPTSAVMTITNDDGAALFNFNPTSLVTQAEGSTYTLPVVRTFSVGSTTGTDLSSTVNFSVAGVGGNPPFPITASGAGADVTSSGGSINFTTSNTVNVSVVSVDDAFFEPTERFVATLTSVSGNGSLGTNLTRNGDITDNDPTPVFLIRQNRSQVEGNAGTTAMIFDIDKISGDAQYAQTVRFNTTDGGGATAATAPSDYTAIGPPGDIVVFGQGQTNAQFAVIINGDTTFENDETYTVTINRVTIANAACTVADPPCLATSIGSPASRTGTIVNDDAAPVFTIGGNVTVTEGNAGTTNATFTVNKVGATELASIVSANTVDGSAVAPGDYQALVNAAVANFAPADTTKTFNVLVNGDTIYESNETFQVNLSNVTNGTFGTPISATGTINNDEPVPNVTFTSNILTPTEGAAATTTVTLAFPAGTTGTALAVASTCTAAVISGNSTVDAQSGDFSSGGQTITFAAGSANGATMPCNVGTTQDSLFEGPENFRISNAGNTDSNGNTPASTGGPFTATIINDDACAFVATNVSQFEGNAGTSNFVHSVNKTCNTGTFVGLVSYASTDGTAISPVDYTQILPGTLAFQPAETSKPLPVSVNGDLTVEPDETYNLCIIPSAACTTVSPLGATVNGVAVPNGACGVAVCAVTNGVGTILNDDGNPITISGTITNFSPAGPLANVTVTLSGSVSATTTTNASGFYSFTNLLSGGNYLITPTPPAGNVMSPTNRSLTGATASTPNLTTQNFVAYNTGNIPRGLNIGTSYTAPGSPVTVPVTFVTAQGDEAAVSGSFNYNAAILNSPVLACGSGSVGCTLTQNTLTPGVIGFTVEPTDGTNPTVYAAGTRVVVNVTFNTAATAAPNTPVTWADVPTLRRTADPGSNPLPTVYNNGLVVFGQGLEADVATRNSGDGSVLPGDVVQVRRFTTGLDTVNPAFNEFQRADSAPAATRGNGQMDAADVIQARRYSTALDPTQTAGGPFVSSGPAPFEIPVIGKGGKGKAELEAAIGRIIRVTSATGSNGTSVFVDVELDAEGNIEAALQTTVNFDPTKLSISSVSSPAANPDVTIGTGVPGGSALTVNGNQANAGRIGFLVDSSNTFAASPPARQVVRLRFMIAPTANPGPGNITTPLTFGNVPVPQSISDATGNPITNFTNENGTVTILGPSAAGVSVSGRVMTPAGAGLRGATVVITDQNGVRRTVTTSTFGYYQFEDVAAGETYVIGVTSRRFRFASRTLQVLDNLTDVDFTGQE